jgi:hypothetical protein
MKSVALTAVILSALLCLSGSQDAFAKGSSGHSSSHSSHSHRTSKSSSSKSGSAARYKRNHVADGYTAHPSVQRDSHGKIKRSAAAKDAFKRERPCPSAGKSSGRCPGYVIDHVKALECGGADAPSNMQWQTVAAGKAKDKTERYCR